MTGLVAPGRAAACIAALAAAACLAALVHFRRVDQESVPWTPALEKGAPGRFLKTSQGVTHYELCGEHSPRTVVLIPGYAVPYYVWDATFTALCGHGFRVLRYDLFGRGLSERPDLRYDGDLYDRQWADLLDGLDIRERADIVGASAGGPIAAAFVCRHPERVRSLTLVDPAFSRGGRVPISLRFPLIGEYVMATRDEPRMPQKQTEDFAHPERFPDWAERFRAQVRIKGFRNALLSTRRNYFREDWSKTYVCAAGKGFPVLLVWGKLDRVVDSSDIESLRAAMPGAEFLAVDDAGHLPMVERPEVVTRVIEKYLSQR